MDTITILAKDGTAQLDVKSFVSEGTRWYSVAPIGRALGFSRPTDAIVGFVSPANITTLRKHFSVAKPELDGGEHPMTKFANARGLYEIVRAARTPSAARVYDFLRRELCPRYSEPIAAFPDPVCLRQQDFAFDAVTRVSLVYVLCDDRKTWLLVNPFLRALGFSPRPRDVVSRHVDTKDYTVYEDIVGDRVVLPSRDSLEIRTLQATSVFVNESGVSQLILGSQMPKSEAFARWVDAIVLPRVRDARYRDPYNDDSYAEQQQQTLSQSRRTTSTLPRLANVVAATRNQRRAAPASSPRCNGQQTAAGGCNVEEKKMPMERVTVTIDCAEENSARFTRSLERAALQTRDRDPSEYETRWKSHGPTVDDGPRPSLEVNGIGGPKVETKDDYDDDYDDEKDQRRYATKHRRPAMQQRRETRLVVEATGDSTPRSESTALPEMEGESKQPEENRIVATRSENPTFVCGDGRAEENRIVATRSENPTFVCGDGPSLEANLKNLGLVLETVGDTTRAEENLTSRSENPTLLRGDGPSLEANLKNLGLALETVGETSKVEETRIVATQSQRPTLPYDGSSFDANHKNVGHVPSEDSQQVARGKLLPRSRSTSAAALRETTPSSHGSLPSGTRFVSNEQHSHVAIAETKPHRRTQRSSSAPAVSPATSYRDCECGTCPRGTMEEAPRCTCHCQIISDDDDDDDQNNDDVDRRLYEHLVSFVHEQVAIVRETERCWRVHALERERAESRLELAEMRRRHEAERTRLETQLELARITAEHREIVHELEKSRLRTQLELAKAQQEIARARAERVATERELHAVEERNRLEARLTMCRTREHLHFGADGPRYRRRSSSLASQQPSATGKKQRRS